MPLGDSYYPDIVVVCGEVRPSDEDDQIEAATLVIEVSSPLTLRYDAGCKRLGYLSVPPLKHYVLIDPMRTGAEIISRDAEGSYRGQFLRDPDDILELPAIEYSVRLGDLYAD